MGSWSKPCGGTGQRYSWPWAGCSSASADPEPIFGLAGRVFNAMFSGDHNKEPKDKEPTDQYGAPSDSYGAPVDSYGAPACACRRTFGNKDKDKDNKDKDTEPSWTATEPLRLSMVPRLPTTELQATRLRWRP